MKLKDFKLEVFFGKHEFTAPYLLTQSDCESMSVKELLALEPGSTDTLLESRLGYTEVSGSPELREEIAKLYSTMDKENIIVHIGAQEPIFNFMNVFLNKEDHVISQFPIYQSLFTVADAIGCEVSKWTIKQGSQGWFMDIDELESQIKPNTKLICLNNPNNPTGFIFSEAEMIKIAEIAREHGIYVFCDEVYKGLELDGIKRPWFSDIYEKGVSLGVMSKAYGLAGLRIGWIATSDGEILDKMIKMKHYTSICCSSTSELLSIVALKHSDDILAKNLALIEKNLKIADAFFEKYSELFIYNRPQAGPIGFHKMNIKTPIKDFVDKLVDESGVLLLASDIYDFDGQYFRMGYGRSGFEASLKHFEDYLCSLDLKVV